MVLLERGLLKGVSGLGQREDVQSAYAQYDEGSEWGPRGGWQGGPVVAGAGHSLVWVWGSDLARRHVEEHKLVPLEQANLCEGVVWVEHLIFRVDFNFSEKTRDIRHEARDMRHEKEQSGGGVGGTRRHIWGAVLIFSFSPCHGTLVSGAMGTRLRFKGTTESQRHMDFLREGMTPWGLLCVWVCQTAPLSAGRSVNAGINEDDVK